MRRRALGALWLGLAAGCAGSSSKLASPAETVAVSEDAATRLARLYSELQDVVLTSYERNDPPELDTSGVIDPRIGTARIGAGPSDLYIAGDLAAAPSRWPLDVDQATHTEVRSKNLHIDIATDQSAAWVSDEVSWRIEMCKRMAVIPLRITALYAHDGDRWIPVFEHLSYGFPSVPTQVAQKQIKTEVISGDLRDELAGVVGRGLLHAPHDLQAVAQDASALVIGPDARDEWRGAGVPLAQLPAGTLEDRRVGMVGRNARTSTIAYWIGDYLADLPARPGVAAGKARMRVTFVFEKRPAASRDDKQPAGTPCAVEGRGDAKKPACRWTLVQSHMSEAITDEDLTQQIFGTALVSVKPLSLDCADNPPS